MSSRPDADTHGRATKTSPSTASTDGSPAEVSEPMSKQDEHRETTITRIRATDVALGLRRVPAGFHAVVRHGGLAWRTEIALSSVDSDVVEWLGAIPTPSNPSAVVRLEVYASFERQSALGDGEQLRGVTVTVEELWRRSTGGVSFTFFPKGGDVVSPCSSISVTLERHECGRTSSSMALRLPHSPTDLERMTNQGHAALLRFSKHEDTRDLEQAVDAFERALAVCPRDHPGRAAAQSNLATATLVLCRVRDANASSGVCLRLYHDALTMRPIGHLDRPSTLVQLAAVYLARFHESRDELEGARVEALLREATRLSPAGSHENRAATWMLHSFAGRRTIPTLQDGQSSDLTQQELGVSSLQLLQRFEQFGDLADLEHAITLSKELVRFPAIRSEWYLAGLGNLGVAFSYRFKRLGELEDLEGAISILKDAADRAPYGDPARPTLLNNLGSSFRVRFQHLGQSSDLDEAISTLRAASDLTPRGHPDHRACLTNLGLSLATRFERRDDLNDINYAISALREAVSFTPDGHPHRPISLNGLALCLRIRFQRVEELSDLQEAISTQKDAADLFPRDHPGRPTCLMNLGTSLATRFLRLGELSDLESAVSTLRDAVELTPHGHSEKPDPLRSLGTTLIVRFRRLGDVKDLEDAISMFKTAVDLTPDHHPDKSGHLNSLGMSLRVRSERLGELSDLEAAISTLKVAADITPDGHPVKPTRIANLGNCFLHRFIRLGELSDLEDGISRHRDAIDLTPDGHPDMPVRLGHLGSSLITRFKRFGEMSDIDEAIIILKDAFELTPDGHHTKLGFLYNLASSFFTRFQHLGELSDLENAISMQRDVVDHTSEGDPLKPGGLDNLGTSLLSRFRCIGILNDLEEAISCQRSAVELTPDGHPDKPKRLMGLGNSFFVRFEHLGEPSDLERAIFQYFSAASAPFGPIRERFDASRNWIRCARRFRHRTLLHAYSIAVDLLPQLAWIGLTLTNRYAALLESADVVREATAAALDAGCPEAAVEWLERGRSIVWGELFQLRSSYDDLSSVHPHHARRLGELSAALERASVAREKSLSALSEVAHGATDHTPESLQQEADRHRALAVERDKLLKEIRRLPGFERFLLHKEFSQLRASAHAGPVVMLNAAEDRCDALIVIPGVDHVIHVPLPKFTFQRSAGLWNMLQRLLGDARVARSNEARAGRIATRDGVSWESLLAVMWKDVVKPVLDALAFSSPGVVSRVFWCPTGPFTFLPIHAAGLYDAQCQAAGHKAFDFVISSYVPTLSILAPSPVPVVVRDDPLRLLVVRQPPSDGLSRLPGVVTEVEHIRAVVRNCSAHAVLAESTHGTVEEVLGMMTEADWVHFACHGIQDAQNPTSTGLCLADGRRLTLRDVIALSRPRRGLAFLSACQTATGDERLSDEAIHVAAGMLYAGYEGVVGTMWSISDKLAPDVALEVYSKLLERAKPDHREAAWALHETMRRIRETGRGFVAWLPFVHVGL